MEERIAALEASFKVMARQLEEIAKFLDSTRRHVGLSHLRKYDEQEMLINSRVRDRVS